MVRQRPPPMADQIFQDQNGLRLGRPGELPTLKNRFTLSPARCVKCVAPHKSSGGGWKVHEIPTEFRWCSMDFPIGISFFEDFPATSPELIFSKSMDVTTSCLRSAACALPRTGNPTSDTEIVAAKKRYFSDWEAISGEGPIRGVHLNKRQKMAFGLSCRLCDFMWWGLSSRSYGRLARYGAIWCDAAANSDSQVRPTGWWFEPLWKIWKSIGMIIPNIWENKKCSKPPTRAYSIFYLQLDLLNNQRRSRRQGSNGNDK